MGSVPINKKLLVVISLIIEIICIFIIYKMMEYELDKSIYHLAFLLSGPVYYKVVEAKYRNKRARHKYEKETNNIIINNNTKEKSIGKRRGLSSPKIMGVNNTRIDGDTISSSTNIVERTSDMFIKKM